MHRILFALVLACSLLPSAFAGKTVNYYELPRKKLLKLAEEGDREAIWQLQRPSYFDPRKKQNVTRTLEERLPWMRKGAELGDYRLQFNLAHHLLLPPAGTATDPAAAEPLLVAAIAEANRRLGREFLAGQLAGEGPKMLARARQLQKLPALLADDSPAALFEAAQAYVPLKLNSYPEVPLGDAAEHRRLVELAAQKGHVEAIVYMADHSPSREAALPWRSQAAERGHVPSMEGMAAELAGRDKAAAREWLRRAAQAGSSNSAYWLGMHAADSPDKGEAIKWFSQAAAAGHTSAQQELARLTDPTITRLSAAAEKGDANAAYELGAYHRQRGDRYRARVAFSRARALGHADAGYQYALLQDDAAAKLYEMKHAAAGGHAGARAWLAGEDQRAAQAARAAVQQVEDDRRRVFVARIDSEGSTDKLEVETYCQYGGRRCNELRGVAHRAEQSRNAQVQSGNMRRLQDVYSTQKGDSDAAHRARSECMQRKTESIQRNTYGQQDWKYTGECR